MLFTALAQVSLALSITRGRPLSRWAIDRLLDGALAATREFGPPDDPAMDALGGPTLDADLQDQMALTQFRRQVRRAVRETRFYAGRSKALGIDLDALDAADIGSVPITTKDELRDDPGAFISRSGSPSFIAATTGTTGTATHVAYSARELHSMIGLTALAHLTSGEIRPDDVVQLSTSSRATLGNTSLAGACARIGAAFSITGMIAPEDTLGLLARRVGLPGKKPQVSVLLAYPSYLGQLVETGRRLGHGPADFGVERILTGGETVTQGLRRAAHELFGPVEISESYAMTETIPFGAAACGEGHLHFAPTTGLLEIVDPESGQPADPGAVGTIVATPFASFRQTTLLLRFDTEDVVRRPVGPLGCRLRDTPATSLVLGKLRHSVRHEGGWTFPRDVLEPLEGLADVPLPARCGIRAVDDGVGVEVVTRDASEAARRAIGDALESAGVPLRELRLTSDASELRKPIPLRCDLVEHSFGAHA